jgi:hypothetical protein
MTTPFPRRIFTAALGAEILMNSGCMSQKAISHALKTSQVLPDPAPVGRPLDEVLANFGAQIVPYYGVATNFRPIVIEIDHMPNDSGIDKELPINIGTYARIAVEKIGRPLQSYMAWPAIMAIPRYVGIPVPPNINNRPKPPEPTFRLVGSLLRHSEILEKRSDGRIDVRGGGGRTEFDAQHTRDKGTTITKIQIALTLEHPNGVAVEGAMAVYEIEVARTELNRSISVYIAGTGIGFGGKYIATQNSGDAIADAVAVSVVHTLGNALKIPYHRAGALFKSDSALEARMRTDLRSFNRSALERLTKRFLFADGFAMDISTPDLTPADRAVAVVAMQRHSLDFANNAALADFAFSYWRNLDYHKAAKHITAVLGSPRPTQAAAESAILPADFGLPPSTPIVILDVSSIPDTVTRNRIVSSARLSTGCTEIRRHPKSDRVLALRTTAQAEEVKLAVSRTGLALQYAMPQSQTPILIVAPAPAPARGPISQASGKPVFQ